MTIARFSRAWKTVVALVIAFAAPALAGVKIAGVDFVPKDLIFAAPEARSRATAEGSRPNECKWDFVSETRVGKREDPQGKDCVRYYYKTTVTLEQTCPAPNDKSTGITKLSERITSAGPFCPDASGKIAPPHTEARVLSSGTTAEGKHQDVLTQPDGTRITLLYDSAVVQVVATYPDSTTDVLALP
ncbi:MAG TPA: hypothetical protein VLV78_08345 [Thermoanaerobaculia bacterium]|nr:hypothetical protein [Thermoanaerobaculia bacterium]